MWRNKEKRNQLFILLFFTFVLILLTFSFKLIFMINATGIRMTVNCFLYLLLGFVAFLFIKLSKLKSDYGFKNRKAYLIGILLAIGLELIIGVFPALMGFSLIGEHRDFALWYLIGRFFYYVLIVGPVEELIFRVYIQDTIIELLPRNKWLGVVLASMLFGFWHIINGNLIQVLFATLLGLAFGFTKYSIKNCKYVGVAVSHGLYDFLNVVTTILVVK